MAIENKANLPLALGLWCYNNEYDLKPDLSSVSATSLTKPLRQLILSRQFPEELSKVDLIDLFAARRGTAIHDSIEKALLNKELRTKYLLELGWDIQLIEKIQINPETVDADCIPFYVEKRFSKNINGWNVSGKVDFVMNGELHDFKTTSVHTYINDSNKESYILQGSIYRWLAHDIITSDVVNINYIFTDWSRTRAETDENYPKYPIMVVPYKLLSLEETQEYVVNRLYDLVEHEKAGKLPICSPEELWLPDPVYKYYSQEGKKCLKKFDNMAEASAYLTSKGKGFIKVDQPTPKRCLYCPVYNVCTQKDEFFGLTE